MFSTNDSLRINEYEYQHINCLRLEYFCKSLKVVAIQRSEGVQHCKLWDADLIATLPIRHVFFWLSEHHIAPYYVGVQTAMTVSLLSYDCSRFLSADPSLCTEVMDLYFRLYGRKRPHCLSLEEVGTTLCHCLLCTDHCSAKTIGKEQR